MGPLRAAACGWLVAALAGSCGPAGDASPQAAAGAAAKAEEAAAKAPAAEERAAAPDAAPDAPPGRAGVAAKPPPPRAAEGASEAQRASEAQAPAQPAPTAQAPAPAMPLGELLGRRDLWPKKVALAQPLTIAPGVTLPAGRELALYDFDGGDVVLDDGEDVFACPPERTDVLERAFAYRASLTPEQLALGDDALGARPELWPVQATVTRRMQFQTGKSIPIGREVTVRSISNGWANLYDAELADHFQAELFETDVLVRARERLLLPEAERRPFFARAVAAALEPSPGAGDPELAKAEYVLVYRVRKGCPRCAAFAPALAEFYGRVKPAHPGFEAVFYSDDKSAEDARAVREAEQLPGRALRFDRRVAAAELANQAGALLPLVYLYDASGRLVANNHPDGGRPSAEEVLAIAEAKLAEGR